MCFDMHEMEFFDLVAFEVGAGGLRARTGLGVGIGDGDGGGGGLDLRGLGFMGV